MCSQVWVISIHKNHCITWTWRLQNYLTVTVTGYKKTFSKYVNLHTHRHRYLYEHIRIKRIKSWPREYEWEFCHLLQSARISSRITKLPPLSLFMMNSCVEMKQRTVNWERISEMGGKLQICGVRVAMVVTEYLFSRFGSLIGSIGKTFMDLLETCIPSCGIFISLLNYNNIHWA